MNEKEIKQISFTLFTAFLLLTIGSSYYHLRPNNETLVYDRIPIVIILMSFFGFIIYDCIDYTKGYKGYIIFNIVGLLSVLYWIATEHTGKGDLRLYILVQFYPIIAIPLILVFYKSSLNYKKEIILIFLFFGLAKVCEGFDKVIFILSSNAISGHSLKHILMVGAGLEIVKLMRKQAKVI